MDDESVKVNFVKPMLVLKIRETYKAPYHKNKFLMVRAKDVKNKKDFIKFMKQFTINWSSGVYELQFLFSEGFMRNSNIYSTFIRFDVRDGKVVRLWKNSPYSRREYPIWQYFEKPKKKRKVVKKPKKVKKKPKKVVKKVKKVKKKIKKKPVKKKVKKKIKKPKKVKKPKKKVTKKKPRKKRK